MLVLTSMPGAPWLPPCGRADAVLAQRGDVPPEHVGLVRLLVTDPVGRVFAVSRTGGRPGLDLPTAAVNEGESPGPVLERLVLDVAGQASTTSLLGYVRNTLPAGAVYEWPTPVAHFCVYRVTEPVEPVVEGVWLDREEAAAQLGERHWWPLVAVDREAAVLATENLAIAAGTWLNAPPGDRDGTVAVATDALVIGLDTPALRQLAGLDRDAEWSEIQDLLSAVAAELGLVEPTLEGAVRAVLARRCRGVLDGAAEVRDLVYWAGEWDTVSPRLSVLEPFLQAYWEYEFLDDLREIADPAALAGSWAELDDQVRRAAADFLRDEELRREPLNVLSLAEVATPGSPGVFLDFVVDGASLRDLVADAETEVTPFSSRWVPGAVRDNVQVFLGRRPDDARLESGRIVLLGCSECGDLGCSAVTADLELTSTRVRWSRFRWDGMPEPSPEDYVSNLHDGFVFDCTEYEATILSALGRLAVAEVPAPNEGTPAPVRRRGLLGWLLSRRV